MKKISRNDLDHLSEEIARFANERDWDKFHTPKNLAAALCVEAAELLEPFQWLASGSKEELDKKAMENIQHEMADVFIYLIRLADKLDVDLIAAAKEKLAINAAKYPADLVRGDSRKYDQYDR